MRNLKLFGAIIMGTTLTATVTHAATPYDGLNVLIQNNFQSQFSEVQGVLAVGGNATLFNYGVDLLSTPYGGAGGYGLVVGGNLAFSSGAVGTLLTNPAQTYHGGAVSGALVNYTGGTVTAPTLSPVNFTSLFSQAASTSTLLAGYTVNGATTLSAGINPQGVTFTGDGSSSLQVFSISGTDLQSRNQIVVNSVPTTSTILVNVTGGFAQLASLDGASPFAPFGDKVLFNFKDATQVNLANTGLDASILAPNAVITSSSGYIEGIVIAKDWNGDFAVKNVGTLPNVMAVPEPETYAMMLAGLGLMGFVARRRKQAQEGTIA